MSYATLADVEARLPQTVRSEGDYVRLADVRLEQTYQEINARLAERYSVPVSQSVSPQFYALLQAIQADLVAADVIEYVREAASDAEAALWYAEHLREHARQALDRLADGTDTPADAVLAHSGGIDDGYDALDENQQQALAPFFRRGDVW
ncbi:hypothetical protein [Pseudomonas sp.]|uniref:hypothetical protein n=1 Tax=Pseudomonas sp. TaxID=306 RepID=UPI003D11620D